MTCTSTHANLQGCHAQINMLLTEQPFSKQLHLYTAVRHRLVAFINYIHNF